MRRLLAVLLFVCSASAQALLGQTGTSVAPGARVRVTLPHEQPRTAVVVARTSDTLVVRWTDQAETAALPLGGIARLELSTGRHRSVAKGAGWGALIGAGAGAILGAATYTPCDGFDCIVTPNSRGEATAYGAAGGGALGLIIGSLVGLQTHEEWQRVWVVPSVATTRGVETGFRVRLAF